MSVAEDGALTAAFAVQKEGFYRIELAGREGRLQHGFPDYTIDVLQGPAAVGPLTKPGRDTKVTSIEEVFTELTRRTTSGGARGALDSVNGGPRRRSPSTGAVRAVGLGRPHLLPGELSLEPGDFISYFAARDRPEPVPPDRHHRHLLPGGPSLKGVPPGGRARAPGVRGARGRRPVVPAAADHRRPPSSSCATAPAWPARSTGRTWPRSRSCRAGCTTRCSRSCGAWPLAAWRAGVGLRQDGRLSARRHRRDGEREGHLEAKKARRR